MAKYTTIILSIVGITCLVISVGFILSLIGDRYNVNKQSIKVGILHSFTGSLALSEKPVVDAELLAIKEINEAGGVLGRKIEPVLMDGASDEKIFAQKAEELITKEKVNVIFGCWTSASRKMVKPVVEKYYHLLFYPVQYEGFEQSPNIIYTGAAPNQQIIPGITWCFKNIGNKFFLVGSDYIFPRAANKIINSIVQVQGGKILGEEYIPLGGTEVDAIIKKIVDTKPQVIINTINGDSNIHFFKALRAAGISSKQIATMSFSIAEPELSTITVDNVVGDYTTWGYFQTIADTTNYSFIARFKKEYGQDRVISDPLEAAYCAVYLWKNSVAQAGTADPKKIRIYLPLQSFYAPQGMIYIDSSNNHTWRFVRVGQIQENGQFKVIWDSRKAIQPQPFSSYVTQQDWEEFSSNLYAQWGKQWEKPTN